MNLKQEYWRYLRRQIIIMMCLLLLSPLAGCSSTSQNADKKDISTISVESDEDQFDPDNINNQNYLDAIELWDNRDYDAAEFKFLEALNEIPTIDLNSSLNAAYIEMKLGLLYIEVGRYNDALDKLISSYTTFRTHLGYDNKFAVVALVGISDCDIYINKYDRAFASLTDAYKYLTEEETKWIVAQKIAYIYDKIGEYDDAQEWYDRAFSMVQNDFRPIDIAALYNSYGIHLRSIGRYHDAIEALEKAAELIVNSVSDEIIEDLVITYVHLYGLYRDANRIEDATRIIDQAQKLIEEKGESDIIKAFCYMSVAKELSNDDELYIKFSSLAFEIIENTVGINSELGMTYFSDKGAYYFGKAYYDTTLYANALECWEQAISIEKNILAMHTASAATLYGNAAFACLYLGYYEKGIEYAEKDLSILKELMGDDSYNLISAFATKAIFCQKLQLFEEAKGNITNALELYEKYKNDGYTNDGLNAHTFDIAGAIFSHRPDDISTSEFGLTTDYNNAIYYYTEAFKIYYKDYLETGNEQSGYNAIGTLFDCVHTMIEGNNLEDAKKVLKGVLEMGSTIIKPDSQLQEDYRSTFTEILVILYDAEGTDIPFEKWFMNWYES